jgi:hypothetical protein
MEKLARMPDLEVPSTMRSLVAPKFCTPSGYEVIDMPVPKIRKPDDVLIRLYAGGLQTGDTQIARGASRILTGKPGFPMKIGGEGVGLPLSLYSHHPIHVVPTSS